MGKQPTVQEMLSVAFEEVGYVEEPVNKTKYGKHFGMQGAQWCGLFVQWVAEHAGYKHFPKTYYTPAGAEAWRSLRKWHEQGEIKPGDIVYFDFPSDGVDRISHVGIAVRHLADGTVITIEGNTSGNSTGDQRNGGMVAIKKRYMKDIVGWARPDYTQAIHPIVPTIVEAYKEDIKPQPAKKVAKKVAKK